MSRRGTAAAQAARGARDREIVRMAIEGLPPRTIHARLEGTVSINTVTLVLVNARKAGEPVPRFGSGGAAGKPDGAGKPRRLPPRGRRAPEPPPSDPDMTAEDDALLISLVGRRVGLTAIAARMRKPYRVLVAAMERLGLARAPAD